MLKISNNLSIPDHKIELHAIRAQGAGGQHVNKVSSAIHLRFDIHASSLPDACKIRLCNSHDGRISQDGVIIIKAQNHRTQAKNKADALLRLQMMIQQANIQPKIRKTTRVKQAAIKRRLDNKTKRSETKALRQKLKI